MFAYPEAFLSSTGLPQIADDLAFAIHTYEQKLRLIYMRS